MPLLPILFATSLFFATPPVDPSIALAARLARLPSSTPSASPLSASPLSASPLSASPLSASLPSASLPSAIRLEAEPASDESPFSRAFARSH